MIQQEKEMAIARACGREDVNPRYFSDLNAMHEAEGILTLSEEQLYFETLHETAGNTMFYRATAAQRAEAFGKTLNLWQ